MSSRGQLLSIGLVFLVLGRTGTATEPHLRRDRYGDPLPRSARARMGTIRFRHGGEVNFVAFAADGKTLIAAGGDEALRVWEVPSGRELKSLPLGEQEAGAVSLSPDGKTIAILGPVLRLLDLATGKERHRLSLQEGGIQNLTFAPDGKSLAVLGGNQTLYRWTPAAGTGPDVLIKLPPPQANQPVFMIASLAFSPDGRVLAAGGVMTKPGGQGEGIVRRWDLTGTELGRLTGMQNGVLAFRFSPDGKRLAALDATQQTLRLFDLATGKQLHQLAQQATQLAFSPDGKVAVAAADGVQFWDPVTGKQLRKLPAEGNSAYALAFSPDGKFLAAGTAASRIRLWDLATDKEVGVELDQQDVVSAIAIAPDGKLLATIGASLTIHIWDTATGQRLRRLERRDAPEEAAAPEEALGGLSLAFLPGSGLLAAGYLDGKITLWDTASGMMRLTFQANPGGVVGLAPAPDGKTLASSGADGIIHLWDVSSGRERRQFKVPAPVGAEEVPAAAFLVAFSLDGKTIGSAGNSLVGTPDGQVQSAVRLWEVSTGQSRRQFAVPAGQEGGPPPAGIGLGGGGIGALGGGGNGGLMGLAFAPGGRRLAVGAGDTIYLCDPALGKEVRRFGGKDVQAHSLVFTPDGKRLLAGDTRGKIHFWDVDTGTALFAVGDHRGPVAGLSLSRDGTVLASAGMDGTALTWDVADLIEQGQAESRPVVPQRLDALWNDLAGADAARAFDAICALSVERGRAVDYLRARLQPIAQPDRIRLERLIADLNSDRFDVRIQAADALEKLEDLAEPALRQALRGRPSLEVRRRIDRLLERIEGPINEPQQLRNLRSIEVLEQIGTPDARQVLEKLSSGAPGARLTREAKAALERLAKVPPVGPR